MPSVVTPNNLAPMFDIGVIVPGKISVKTGPGLKQAPGGALLEVDPTTLEPIVAPMVVNHQTVTTLTYDPTTKILTYTNEVGSTVTIDLSALAVDVFVTGATYDAGSMTLTLTDNSTGTPDIVIPLAHLKQVAVNTSGDVILTGTGEISNPLTANAKIDPAPGNLLSTGPAGLLVPTSAVSSIVASMLPPTTVDVKIDGLDLLVEVNGVNDTVTLPATNSLTSLANTMTSVVNGTSSSAPIVNSVTLTITGNNLTASVNGVTSAAVALPTLSITSNVLSINAAGALRSTIDGLASNDLPLPDFWRQAATFDPPNNTATDLTGAIRRNGNVGILRTPRFALDVNGAVAFGVRGSIAAPLSGAVTINATDHVVIVAAGATVTLPNPSSEEGRILEIKKASAVGTVTFTGASIDQISPAVLTLANPWQSQTLVSDGGTWVRI